VRLLPIALGLIILLVAVAAGVALFGWTKPPEQPIAFNHRLHVEENGAECTDCHAYALTGVRATIPNLEICANCHAEAMGESPEEARLVKLIEAGKPIPWRKVYWVPDNVYFSHRRHTAIAGIECERCHGSIRDRSQPLTRRLVPVTMERCMRCHQETGTPNDCVLCHR